MKTFLKFFVILTGLLFSSPLYSQETEHHDHGNYEIGIGAGAVYHPAESEFSPGIHLHLIRKFNHWLGAGVGYEMITGDHFHQSIGFMADFAPFEWLSMDMGPSLVLPDKVHTSLRLAFHTELALVFHLEKIHIGPLIDLGVGKEDVHMAFGAHLGFDL